MGWYFDFVWRDGFVPDNAADMALHYRRDRAAFAEDDRLIAALPVSAARPRSKRDL